MLPARHVLLTLLFLAPIATAQDFARFVAVSDRTSASVQRFDPATGAFKDRLAGPLSIYAEGLAFGPDQNLYVSDAACRCIHKFDGESGRYLGQIVRAELSPLRTPEGLTFGPDGNLYVADIESNAVLRYDVATGNMIDTFVKPNAGGLTHPVGLAFGPDGNLYVTSGTPTTANPNETLSPQVLRFAGDTGEFAGVFVTERSGGLEAPFDLLFGPDGLLYVSSVLTNSVLRYDAHTGSFVDAIVKPGSGGLQRPTGLAFAPDGDLLVCSAIGPNLGVLRYDARTGDYKGVFIAGSYEGLRGPTDILVYSYDRRQAPSTVTSPGRRRAAH